MKFLLTILASVVALAVGAKEVPARFVAAVQRALDADAQWTMMKTMPELEQPLLSSGVVSCRKEKGMIWKTQKPWEEEIRLYKHEMTFIVDGEAETKTYDEMPYYAEICKATDAFLAGDTDAFDDLFDWTWQEGKNGEWVMTLEVNYRQMRRLLKTITLTGNEVLSTITFISDDTAKGVTHLKFHETGRSVHTLWTVENDK